MKIGVLSDTHKNLHGAIKAIDYMGPVDLLLHAGDYLADAQIIGEQAKLPIKAVVGNCDVSAGPAEEIIEVAGFKILLTHGHQYGVKHSLQKLIKRAKDIKAQIVVYGHTHIPAEEYHDGILFFNPGSISIPRGLCKNPSYGIIYINEDKEVHAHIHEINEE